MLQKVCLGNPTERQQQFVSQIDDRASKMLLKCSSNLVLYCRWDIICFDKLCMSRGHRN